MFYDIVSDTYCYAVTAVTEKSVNMYQDIVVGKP